MELVKFGILLLEVLLEVVVEVEFVEEFVEAFVEEWLFVAVLLLLVVFLGVVGVDDELLVLEEDDELLVSLEEEEPEPYDVSIFGFASLGISKKSIWLFLYCTLKE